MNFHWADTGGTEPKYLPYRITEAEFQIAVRGYSGVFDGKEHPAVIVDDAQGATVLFQRADGSWSTTVPVVRTVEDSRTVNVKAVKTNYMDTPVYTLDATVFVLEIAVPETEIGLVYDGTEKVAVHPGQFYTVTGGSAVEAGDYVATVSLDEPGSTVWVGGGTDTKQIPYTIYDDVPISMTPYSGSYDGQEHPAFTINNIVEGTVVQYRLWDGTVTSEMPMIRAAGSYEITVIADKEGYAHYESSRTISIVHIEVAFPNAMTGLEYDGQPKTGVPPGEYYNVENGVNVEPGVYVARVTLKDTDGCVWADTFDTSARELEYVISGVHVDFTPYTGTYDGSSHPVVAINDAHGATVEYSTDMMDWSSVVPQVKDVADSGTFFMRASIANGSEAYYRIEVDISKAPLTVTADDKTMRVNDPYPEFTFTASGLKGTDTVKDLDCKIVFTTDYAPGMGIGTYLILSNEAYSDRNYEITTQNGSLAVGNHFTTIRWVYTEYIYTGNDIIVMVDVTDENGTPVAYSVIVTDTEGNPAVFREKGDYVVRIVLSDGYVLEPSEGNTDTMTLSIVNNEAFDINWKVMWVIILVVSISALLVRSMVKR